mgnify:CR=1 FL=1
MEFESVRSERDANEESPFLQRSSDPGVILSVLYHQQKEEKEKIGKNLLSSFEIGFDHIFVIEYR